MPAIRKVFETKAFEEAMILAGDSGLDSNFQTITVAEVPDAADWLRGGEIVCTTGFFVRDSSVSQVRWVESLIERNASALAIKTTRFLGDISEGLRLLAESRKFPIIGLPAQVTWPFVIESVMNLVNDEQLSMLRQIESIHRELTELVLSGSSLSAIAQALSNLLNNPIVIEDGRFELISASLPVSVNPHTKQGKLMQLAVQERTDETFQASLLHSEYYRQVITGRRKDPLRKKLRSFGGETLTLPVIAGGVVYGFLTLLEVGHKHSSIDVAALEHGATAISLNLIRDTIQINDRRQQEQEAVKDLIRGRLRTDALKNIGLTSIDWSRPMVAVLLECEYDGVVDPSRLSKQPEHQLEQMVRAALQKEFGSCVIGYDGTTYTILIPLRESQHNLVVTILADLMDSLVPKFKEQIGVSNIRVTIGGLYQSRDMLQQSFLDAQRTMDIVKMMPSLGSVVFYQQVGMFQLIHGIKDPQILRTYRDGYISELISHDEKNSDSLCETLYAYLKLSGNVTLTAKHLYVHPNTVAYRIRKIQGILSDKLDNADYRISLLVALGIHEYLQTITP